MPNVTLPRITTTYNSAAVVNLALEQIEEQLNEVLSRLGETPNQMQAALDMNSQRIMNLPPAGSDNEPITYGQWRDAGVLNIFTPGPHTHVWADITDKPTAFTPVVHGHQIADIIGLQSTLTSLQSSITTFNSYPRVYVQASDPGAVDVGSLWIY